MFANLRSLHPPGYWRDIVAADIHHMYEYENFFSVAWTLKSVWLLSHDDIKHLCKQEHVVGKAEASMRNLGLDVDRRQAREFLECYQMFTQPEYFEPRWYAAIRLGIAVANQLESNNRTGLVNSWNAFNLEYQHVSLIDKVVYDEELAAECKNKLKILLVHDETGRDPTMLDELTRAFVVSGNTEARRSGRMHRIEEKVQEWFVKLEHPVKAYQFLLDRVV